MNTQNKPYHVFIGRRYNIWTGQSEIYKDRRAYLGSCTKVEYNEVFEEILVHSDTLYFTKLY